MLVLTRRIGEEIVIWSTQEFGFIELDDAFATGSSMMPIRSGYTATARSR